MSVQQMRSRLKRRHARVRKKISGSETRPRLCVYRSNRHMIAQIVDDTSGRTLVYASTHEGQFRSLSGSKSDAASKVGALIAERAVERGIRSVVFDRGGFQYHGRVAALADAARENGLEF